MVRLIGYARVSTREQELDLQFDALKGAGVPESLNFTDSVTGAWHERVGLNACLEEVKKGDTLLVWRIDRLGRSLSSCKSGRRLARKGCVSSVAVLGGDRHKLCFRRAHLQRSFIPCPV